VQVRQNRREWEDLAHIDPMWAILSDDGKRDGGWNDGEFFACGEAEINAVMARATALGLPRHRRTALDFGCGVGRLSRPIAQRFRRCIGVDISQQMIAEGKARHSDIPGLEFLVNETDRIPMVGDRSIDFIYSRIVLQHVSSRDAIRSYLSEFARVLADGGLLVFQLPSYIPLRHRLQPRPRAYSLLRRLGIPRSVLYRRLRLQPIRMRWLGVESVRSLLESRGLSLVTIETQHMSSIDSTTYFLTRG